MVSSNEADHSIVAWDTRTGELVKTIAGKENHIQVVIIKTSCRHESRSFLNRGAAPSMNISIKHITRVQSHE